MTASEEVDAALNSFAINDALKGWRQLGKAENDENSRLARVIVYATVERDGFTLADLLKVLEGPGVRAEPERWNGRWSVSNWLTSSGVRS